MTEETVAWSDAKDAVRAAVGFHEKQKARKSVTMVGMANFHSNCLSTFTDLAREVPNLRGGKLAFTHVEDIGLAAAQIRTPPRPPPAPHPWLTGWTASSRRSSG